MTRFLVYFIKGVALLLTLLTFLGFGGHYFWLFDIFAHFRLQFMVLLMGIGLITLINREQRGKVLWLFPALLANGIVLAPYFIPVAAPVTASPAADVLRVLTLNIYARNRTPDAVLNYIENADADVVVLSEVRPEFMAMAVERLGNLYPYRHDASRRGYFGMALLSRIPLDDAQTHQLGVSDYPSIEATLTWQGKVITLYGAHPHPPLGARGTVRRDSELAEIQALLTRIEGPLILAGDLNASPWSAILSDLSNATGLRNVALGKGIRPTWWYGSLVLGLPYDHVMVSPEWQVASYQVGDDVGSDHFPVMADLYLE